LLGARLLGARLLDRGRWRRLVARLLRLRLFVPLPRFFVRLFRARLELVDAALLLGQGSSGGRLLLERAPLARTIAAIAVTVAAAAVAPSAAVLFAFTLRTRTLGLALGRELVELRRFTP
jgi:hypothetical protein